MLAIFREINHLEPISQNITKANIFQFNLQLVI